MVIISDYNHLVSGRVLVQTVVVSLCGDLLSSAATAVLLSPCRGSARLLGQILRRAARGYLQVT